MSVSESPDDQMMMVKEEDKVPDSPTSAVGTEENKANLQNKGIEIIAFSCFCESITAPKSMQIFFIKNSRTSREFQ